MPMLKSQALHRATGFDEARLKRVMRRCTIIGDKPF